MGKKRLFGKSAACMGNARNFCCLKTTVNHVTKQLLFLSAFVFLYVGAWAQSSTTIAGASGDALHLEVRGVDDASVSATPVERTSPNGKQLYCAYDIDITKDGREWQPEPEQPAMVTMENPDFADGQLLDIYHEGASGLEFVATVASENGKITFPAHSFSVYIVAQAPEYNRLKVVLHRADHTEVTIYVKKFDLEQGSEFFNRVVYNPGLGTPRTGELCMGWTKNASYTNANISDSLNFTGVRNIISAKLEENLADGTEIHFYAMLFKSYIVTYRDDHNAIINTDELLYRADAATAPTWSYRINTSFTPGVNTQHFDGWKVKEGGNNVYRHNQNPDPENHNYPLDTAVVITGDVDFSVNVSNGHWLIFHENGKGATYKAADFIRAGENTVEPTLTMQRKGYTFAGWYTDAPTEEYGEPGGERFVFGSTLDNLTHLYAKWTKNSTAPYTVIFWTQNLNRDGYDVKESYVNNSGTVDTNIPYNSVDNGDEDYATGDFGGGDFPEWNGPSLSDTYPTRLPGHYRGFCLREDSKNQQVVVTPEGDAVLNLYYDRIEYKFKFYLYRNGTKRNRYDYANNSAPGRDLNGLVSWHSNQTEHPDVTPASGFTIQSETVDGKTYYYFVMQAYYGEDISSKWPTYDKITGANDREPVSYVLMLGTKQKPNPISDGTGTVKGVITVMDEILLGATNNANGNYVMVRFPGGTVYNWRYHIWFETIAGEDYSGYTTRTYNNRTYYEDAVVVSRSSGNESSGQNAPAYTGFDFVEKRDEDWNSTSQWTTDNRTLYHINFVYNRQQFKISYFDGNYVNGNNNTIQNKSNQNLYESPAIGQGKAIADEYKNYKPNAQERGYVFEGWYIDEGCTAPYIWSKMTVGGIKVYAKWRQIQYRVFLHPNADAVSDLNWGSEDQTMNFRIDYGKTVSAPTGHSDGDNYQFIGWFTNEACTNPFNEATVLNDDNTTSYDKNRDFTDPMDKWGHLGEEPWNSDSIDSDGNLRNRFWITKKYELYGKWRAILGGADGINIVYDANGGNSAPGDSRLYQDNVDAIAAHACSHSADNMEFSHWVMQQWNAERSEYIDIPNSRILPGEKFTVLKDNSKKVITEWYQEGNPENNIPATDPISTKAPDNIHTVYHATYTVQLRAEYVEDIQKPTYTFIQWFKNDGTNERIDGTSASNPTLAINDAVLPPVPTRTGYNFKGWYRQRVASGDAPATVAECTPNLLYYNNGRYYKEAGYTNQVTHVAADLFEPTDYMYAIWEPIVDFTIPENTCQGDPITLLYITVDGVDLAGTWSADAGTVSGTTYTATDVTSATLTFTPESSTCARANSFPVSFRTPNLATASSYDYIWKGSTADWNTNSNWYVYDSRNSSYSIATEQPTAGKNIYIGPSECVTANWPSQSNEAYAKNITIASTATLTIPEGKTLNIAGNLDNIGTLRASGTVVFCGPSSDGGDQIITNNVEFKNVVFNNLGGNIRPRGNVEINGEATFTSGILEIEAVKFNANSTAVVSDHRSFVSGRVEKTVGELNENFTFPTGSHASGQPDVLGSVMSELPKEKTISVTFYQKSANNGDGTLGFTIDEYPRWWNVADMCPGNSPQLDHVSNYEYWKVNTDVDLVATLTVDAANASAHFGTPNAYNSDMVYAAMYTGGCWKNISNEHGTISSDHQSMSVVANIPRVSLRADEPQIVTLGSTDRSTLLPIELLSFDAECNGNSVELAWATASEKNNDYFSLERSDDAINFTEIARIAGAGNSIERLDYSYTDFGVHGGDNYYRLVQVDYDGTRTASEIIVANCSDMPTEEPEVVAYPNPFDSDLTVELENFGDRPARIDVYDVLGRLVYTEEVAAPQNDYQTVLHLGGLSDATYTVRVATSDFVINHKVVKQQ